MACACAKNRQQWEVINAEGRLMYTGNQSTANQVSQRYKGSIVREKGKTAPTSAAT